MASHAAVSLGIVGDTRLVVIVQPTAQPQNRRATLSATQVLAAAKKAHPQRTTITRQLCTTAFFADSLTR